MVAFNGVSPTWKSHLGYEAAASGFICCFSFFFSALVMSALSFFSLMHYFFGTDSLVIHECGMLKAHVGNNAATTHGMCVSGTACSYYSEVCRGADGGRHL